jgi:hypothetical protein
MLIQPTNQTFLVAGGLRVIGRRSAVILPMDEGRIPLRRDEQGVCFRPAW